MGIKHFFTWFKNNFSENIIKVKLGETLEECRESALDSEGISIDNFMIDMNGIFHNSAQKIYEYGNFKAKERLLGKRRPRQFDKKKRQEDLFKHICDTVDTLVKIVKPKKRVILCVDGPAPLSKQNQQRQRRFMSALNSAEEKPNFDSNCITPGTKFMDFLSKYIDFYIKKTLSEKKWGDIEVIFSNEKSPGEGEHKLINYIRKYGNIEESYLIHGMDADLIMLSLGTHYPNFYILRDELMETATFPYYLINIGGVRGKLSEMMFWESKSNKQFDSRSAINDFIFMCFTVGNDFLPHIPGIEIIEGGIDFMLDVYKKVCCDYGHLTRDKSSGIRFRRKCLVHFLGTLSQYEKGVFEDKLSHREKFFPDVMLESCSKLDDNNKYIVDIEKYREIYRDTNFGKDTDITEVCHQYLDGMQWVLTYYTKGIPDWKWRYPYHYAPFSFWLKDNVKSFKFREYTETSPTLPFIQLLSVLPPKCSYLLPEPLNKVLETNMGKYCPEKIEVDLSGKRQEWEGTVKLPMIDYSEVEKLYIRQVKNIDERERKRNILGKSFLYKFSEKSYELKSYYGEFTCKAEVCFINI
jgi:5'-3' exonuclease